MTTVQYFEVTRKDTVRKFKVPEVQLQFKHVKRLYERLVLLFGNNGKDMASLQQNT